MKIKIITDPNSCDRLDYAEKRDYATVGNQVIVLMNCSIMTGADGIYTVDTTYLSSVTYQLEIADIIISAIGHESTAQIMSELLGVKVPVNRIKYEQLPGETAIIFQLNSRPPEGKILIYQAKISISTSPRQKAGIDTPRSANTLPMLSIQVSW